MRLRATPDAGKFVKVHLQGVAAPERIGAGDAGPPVRRAASRGPLGPVCAGGQRSKDWAVEARSESTTRC